MINIHEYRLPPAREEQAIVTSMMEACWFAAVTSMMEACWIAAITRHERHLAVIKFGLSACSDTATAVSLSPYLPICISYVFVHVYIHMQYLQPPPLSMHAIHTEHIYIYIYVVLPHLCVCLSPLPLSLSHSLSQLSIPVGPLAVVE